MICPAFCTTHRSCDSHIPAYLSVSQWQSIRCQCIEGGCIQDVLLQVGRQNMMLVIRRLCLVQVWRSSRLLLFPVLYLPCTPSLEVLSNSCIKATKNDEHVCSGNSKDNIFKVFIELVFFLIHIGHGGCISADDGSKFFPIMKVSWLGFMAYQPL